MDLWSVLVVSRVLAPVAMSRTNTSKLSFGRFALHDRDARTIRRDDGLLVERALADRGRPLARPVVEHDGAGVVLEVLRVSLGPRFGRRLVLRFGQSLLRRRADRVAGTERWTIANTIAFQSQIFFIGHLVPRDLGRRGSVQTRRTVNSSADKPTGRGRGNVTVRIRPVGDLSRARLSSTLRLLPMLLANSSLPTSRMRNQVGDGPSACQVSVAPPAFFTSTVR